MINPSMGCRAGRGLALLVLVLAPAALAQGPTAPMSSGAPVEPVSPVTKQSLWDHNGSIVSLAAEGTRRRFFYEVPRDLLVKAGVARGTLLFEGARQGHEYSGTAYMFSRKCGPITYQVAGTVSEDQRKVTLYGKAPRRDESCAVVSYRNDVLLFTYRE